MYGRKLNTVMKKLYYSKEIGVAVHNNINSTVKEEARYERQRTITYGNPCGMCIGNMYNPIWSVP